MNTSPKRGEKREDVILSLRQSISNIEHGSTFGSHAPGERFIDFDQVEKSECGNASDKTSRSTSLIECDGLSCDEGKKAYEKILRALGHRDRTVHELRTKLLEAGFSANATENALHQARNLDLVNDDRFCRNYIEQTFRAGKGRRAAINGLKRKGIPESVILIHLEESSFADEDETERAHAFLERHTPQGRNIRECAFRKLIAKGYSISAASTAAKRYSSRSE